MECRTCQAGRTYLSAGPDEALSKARRDVEEGRRLVWQQKGRIARLRAAGLETSDAERTLRILESNLNTFEEHSNFLERE
jgi:hypothetical protein